VIIDVVKTDGITNHNSPYTLSAFKENTQFHYKKVPQLSGTLPISCENAPEKRSNDDAHTD